MSGNQAILDNERNSRAADFIRGFFLELEDRGIPAAVLHGGEDGFEFGVSDVDFVLATTWFERLPELVHDFCRTSGWQLCQIFRHETTAAYLVCSAIDDPACAVALDACTDYQRNGVHFISACDMLEDLESLAWGGMRSSESIRLKYRIAKAAAKGKPLDHLAVEISLCSDDSRAACAKWLMDRWKIDAGGWSSSAIANVLEGMRVICRDTPPAYRAAEFRRIIRRIIDPGGMVVIANTNVETHLEEVFGRVHFRRIVRSSVFRPAHLLDLIRSTMVLIPSPNALTRCLHRSWILDLSGYDAPDEAASKLAVVLNSRCLKRERLDSTPDQ